MIIFSTAVSATAVLIQSVRGEQKLQTADFPFLGNAPPPLQSGWIKIADNCQAMYLPGKIQNGSRLQTVTERCTPPPQNLGWIEKIGQSVPSFKLASWCLSIKTKHLNKKLSFAAGSKQNFMKNSEQGWYFRHSWNEYKKSCATIKLNKKWMWIVKISQQFKWI